MHRAAIALVACAVTALVPGVVLAQPAPGQDGTLRVLLYFGVYTQWYRIEEALQPPADASLRTLNAKNDGADPIPEAEGLAAFGVVVLSDVNRGSMGDQGLADIESFVSRGGGLLVLGGPFTYGEGGSGLRGGPRA